MSARLEYVIRHRHAYRSLLLAIALAGACVLAKPAATMAAAPGVAWQVALLAQPSNFSEADTNSCRFPGSGIKVCDRYTVVVTNVGASTSSGQLSVTVKLPPDVVTFQTPYRVGEEPFTAEWSCTPEGHGNSEITCVTNSAIPSRISADPIYVTVEVQPGASAPLVGEATVTGGVAGCGEAGEPACPSATTTATAGLDGTPPAFAPIDVVAAAFDPAGALDTRAAGHPETLFTSFAFPTTPSSAPPGEFIEPRPVGDPKQIVTMLPPGLVGNPQATPQCALSDLADPIKTPSGESTTHCAPSTQVGILTLLEPSGVQTPLPIFNVVPEHGYAAEFGVFDLALGRPTLLYGSVGPYPDYRVEVVSAPQDRFLETTGVVASLFGNPGQVDRAGTSPIPLFTDPSDCTKASFTTQIFADAWQQQGTMLADGLPDLADTNGWKSDSAQSPAVHGCEALVFRPEFTLEPEAAHRLADEPAGYVATLTVPQNESPTGTATPPVKTVTTTLPAGVSVSPSAANGLLACPATGSEGFNLQSPDEGHCPSASSVGTAKVETPLLKEPLEGQVYVAEPACGGSGQPACTEEAAEQGGVFSLYLEVGSAARGLHLKLEGKVEVGGEGHRNGLAPGQIRTTFAEAPQQPFSKLTLAFKSGARAPLANPQGCGTFQSTVEIEPWSHGAGAGEESGTPDAEIQPQFAIEGCHERFAPALSAGSRTVQAGGDTGFDVTFARADGEQDLYGAQVRLPAGVLGKIAGVPQCGEAQANGGSCPAASRLGAVTASAGAGGDPLWQSGSVYLTGPYRGAPFGLSIVVPAKAGPYNLGDIVVRAAIRVDPSTAQVTVASDPLPQAIDGVPLRIRTVHVSVEREGFMRNPTSCQERSTQATLESAQHIASVASARFQVGGCSALAFKPRLSVSTQHNGELKGHGASLKVHLAFPGAESQSAAAREANTASVKVQLPKNMPSRLTTLQKACTEAQFAANPAGCPQASFVGTAVAHTPILAQPLTGPAILVSHGGAAFPDLDVVLQGEGVEIVLVANTAIKHGVTTSTFASVPDAPVSSFDLTLPEGEHSVLAANGNLCRQKLLMPTTFRAQDGATLQQSTRIEVEGCSDALAVKLERVRNRALTLGVWVPARGRLSAAGKGLSSASKASNGREEVRLTLRARRHGTYTTGVRLTFTPSAGKNRKKLVKSLRVRL